MPVTSRGSRTGRHQVVVANRGNASSEVAVTAEDPDARLRLMVQPPRSVVAPDAKVAFAIRVDVDDPFPFGPERQRPFQVSVTAGRQAPIALRGVLTQRPGLPGWIPPVAGIIGIVALLSIGAFLAKAGPFAPEATPTPSIAQASAPPSAAASLPASQPPSAAAFGRLGTRLGRGLAAAHAAAHPDRPPERDPVPGLRARGPRPLAIRSAGDQRQPLIAFNTDGPGDVVLTPDQERRQQRASRSGCASSLTGATGSAGSSPPRGRSRRPTTRPGTRSWTAFARPTAENSAPFVDLTLTFFATRPLGDLDRQRRARGRRDEPDARLLRVQRDHPRAGDASLLQITTTVRRAARELRVGPVGRRPARAAPDAGGRSHVEDRRVRSRSRRARSCSTGSSGSRPSTAPRSPTRSRSPGSGRRPRPPALPRPRATCRARRRSMSAACAAARRATGTRNGEQDT